MTILDPYSLAVNATNKPATSSHSLAFAGSNPTPDQLLATNSKGVRSDAHGYKRRTPDFVVFNNGKKNLEIITVVSSGDC